MNFLIRLQVVDDEMMDVFDVKVIPLHSDAMYNVAISEVEILKKLHGSPHVIQMHQWLLKGIAKLF